MIAKLAVVTAAPSSAAARGSAEGKEVAGAPAGAGATGVLGAGGTLGTGGTLGAGPALDAGSVRGGAGWQTQPGIESATRTSAPIFMPSSSQRSAHSVGPCFLLSKLYLLMYPGAQALSVSANTAPNIQTRLFDRIFCLTSGAMNANRFRARRRAGFRRVLAS